MLLSSSSEIFLVKNNLLWPTLLSRRFHFRGPMRYARLVFATSKRVLKKSFRNQFNLSLLVGFVGSVVFKRNEIYSSSIFAPA